MENCGKDASSVRRPSEGVRLVWVALVCCGCFSYLAWRQLDLQQKVARLEDELGLRVARLEAAVQDPARQRVPRQAPGMDPCGCPPGECWEVLGVAGGLRCWPLLGVAGGFRCWGGQGRVVVMAMDQVKET